MHTARLYFASNVLPDGRVFVMGGEYSGPNTVLNLINTGEIYDPAANAWTNIANFPLPIFGDAPSEVLPNGQVLAGYKLGPQTYTFDAPTNSWSASGIKLHSDTSREESWVKLPDNSVLSYDITSSIVTGTGRAQRYLPSEGEWVDAGTVPVLLSTADTEHELGPAFLLPDGRVFFLGANGNTAFYTPPAKATDPGSWAAGPSIPNGLICADAPGAMLPNGDVLFAASPGIFPASPTSIIEFNPASNTYTDVTPHNNFSLNRHSTYFTMLVLPTGQVMVANNTAQLDIFTPDAGPNPSWQPTISNITDSGNHVFTLTGTQLNGLSEGAGYGDDAEMSSNYPIVRLSDANGNVSFARSFNWSSTGVATGPAAESVEFALPPAHDPGAYLLSVIANGIASATALDIQMSGANISLALRVDPNSTANLQVLINDSLVGEFPVSSFSSIIVTGSNADNTVAIENSFSGVPVTVNEGTGNDRITVGDPDLNSIQGPLIINGGRASNAAAATSLMLNDQNSTVPRVFTLTDSTIAWGGPIVSYGGLDAVTISGGTGGNTFDIRATSASTALTVVGGSSGDTLIGSDDGNGFTVTGSDAGMLSGIAYASNILFSHIGNLKAGSGGDTFQFGNGASLTGNIVGGGSDTLVYSAYSTSVIVDLQTGFATGVGGSVNGISTVFGGSGTSSASGAYNLLIGKGGDTLYGGFGRRNVLVAGPSASTLVGGGSTPGGGGEQDLLIGGSTAYDTETGLGTWQQIAAYWAATAPYTTRVANLIRGTGVPLLDATVVSGNGGGNALIGYYGELALLYTDSLDTIVDFNASSQQVKIRP
jgi:hypothetical protein